MPKSKATCLCGSVSLVTNDFSEFGACHCGMCRKWGGGPFLTVACGDQVEVQGDHFITTFISSDWAERGFCKVCGTHLYYRMKHNGHYMVPLGLFNETQGSTFASQIFIDKKPDAYSFQNETTNMTEAEVFAKYAPKDQ